MRMLFSLGLIFVCTITGAQNIIVAVKIPAAVEIASSIHAVHIYTDKDNFAVVQRKIYHHSIEGENRLFLPQAKTYDDIIPPVTLHYNQETKFI